MKESKKAAVLAAALSVFLRYGFRRVNMNDIAEAAGVSRAALYLLFKNKEDIFLGVYLGWIDDIVVEMQREMDSAATPEDKLRRAFEICAVQPFELMATSPEARELVECSLGFAQASMRQGYTRIETTIVPVLASIPGTHSTTAHIAPEQIAHILVSAMRGFKQVATTPVELRELIKDLLLLTLDPTSAMQGVG